MEQPQLMQVIAISGKKGTGKDWYASQLMNQHPERCVIVAFADALKMRLYGQDHYDVLAANKTIQTRMLLIETGTRERQEYGPDFFAKQLVALLELYSRRGIRTVIISDLRLEIELFVLQASHGRGEIALRLIRMEAPERNRQRIEQEANGDTQLAARLAQDISEVDLDKLANTGLFEIIYNDPQ